MQHYIEKAKALGGVEERGSRWSWWKEAASACHPLSLWQICTLREGLLTAATGPGAAWTISGSPPRTGQPRPRSGRAWWGPDAGWPCWSCTPGSPPGPRWGRSRAQRTWSRRGLQEFLLWRSVLRIQCCYRGVGCSCGWNSIPGLGLPKAQVWPRKKQHWRGNLDIMLIFCIYNQECGNCLQNYKLLREISPCFQKFRNNIKPFKIIIIINTFLEFPWWYRGNKPD